FSRFDIVIEHHFAAAGDKRPANLDRRQPIEMKVRDKLVVKMHDQVSDVFDALFDMTTAERAQPHGLSADQVIHDGKIVRRQVPEHIYVALKQSQINAD